MRKPGSKAARKKRGARYRQVASVRRRFLDDGQVFFTCPACGKALFRTRDAARRFARRHYPGAELSPYLAAGCDGVSFHLTSQDARTRETFKDHREKPARGAGMRTGEHYG